MIPILRGGLLLCEHADSIIPVNQIYHVGVGRNETTLQPSIYHSWLPSAFSVEDKIVVMDVMLATGGTMMLVLEEIVRRGASVKNIRVICAVAAPPALQKMSEAYPEMQVYAGIIDAEVNDQGLIVPGIGDAGDRAFGTFHEM